MKLSSILAYCKKAHSQIKRLNRRVGRRNTTALFSYVDFLYCYIRYGCLINQYVNGGFWRYRHTERKNIMTYRRVVEFINKCNDSNHIYKLDNKIEFNKYFKNYIKRDWLATEDMSLKDFENMFLFHDQLICKPLNECEGANIRLINPVDKDLRPTEFQNCYELLKKDKYILEERIYNHPKMNFNNNSINTIRVNTLMDRSDNVHIFKPVLRAGVGDSIVDNYNAGGCEYSIDPDTGIITSLCYQDYVLKGIHHPGCDKVMIGYQIPMWDEVLKVIEEACRLIPECRFIGWDVAITSDGVQLIEGNHNPGNVSIEFFGETGWYKKLKQYL